MTVQARLVVPTPDLDDIPTVIDRLSQTAYPPVRPPVPAQTAQRPHWLRGRIAHGFSSRASSSVMYRYPTASSFRRVVQPGQSQSANGSGSGLIPFPLRGRRWCTVRVWGHDVVGTPNTGAGSRHTLPELRHRCQLPDSCERLRWAHAVADGLELVCLREARNARHMAVRKAHHPLSEPWIKAHVSVAIQFRWIGRCSSQSFPTLNSGAVRTPFKAAMNDPTTSGSEPLPSATCFIAAGAVMLLVASVVRGVGK